MMAVTDGSEWDEPNKEKTVGHFIDSLQSFLIGVGAGAIATAYIVYLQWRRRERAKQ